MRRSFIITIFSTIAAAILIVSVLQYSFFEHERRRLIDRQLETVASALIASRLSIDLMENLNEVDSIIQSAVADNRIDLVINIYSEDADVLYANDTGKRLDLELNPNGKWRDIEKGQHYLRTLTIHNGAIFIQVGLILDSTLQRWKLDARRLFFFLMSIFALVGVISFFSARFLFVPIAKLAGEFQTLSDNLNRQLGQPLSEFVIPPTLEKYSRETGSADELEKLAFAIRNFLNLLGDYTKSFQAQTALLTHEIKTPLTVIVNRLEEMQKATPDQLAHLLILAKREVLDLASMVNNYLQWAVFISSPGRPEDVYAIKLGQVIHETAAGLETIYRGRIKLVQIDSPTVFSYPEHVRQVIKNLIENALKYSTGEVLISLIGESLKVEDRGPGIPDEVLKAIGTPFNNSKGADPQRSSGLGLAWVQVICQRYNWKLSIDSKPHGTTVEVNFGGSRLV